MVINRKRGARVKDSNNPRVPPRPELVYRSVPNERYLVNYSSDDTFVDELAQFADEHRAAPVTMNEMAAYWGPYRRWKAVD